MNNIMLDPSLILATNTFKDTFKRAGQFTKLYKDYKFYYPSSLSRLIDKKWALDSPGIQFFLRNAKPVELDVLNTFLKDYSNIVYGFEVTQEHINKYGRAYDVLLEELEYGGELPDKEDRYLCDILFEEFVFSQEQSWIVSRIKKPFNRFLAAGTTCVQYSLRTFDALAKRTLKKEQDEFLTNINRLRAFGKWIAVGGASASALISPVVAGVAVSATFGYILLFDPNAEVARTTGTGEGDELLTSLTIEG